MERYAIGHRRSVEAELIAGILVGCLRVERLVAFVIITTLSCRGQSAHESATVKAVIQVDKRTVYILPVGVAL